MIEIYPNNIPIDIYRKLNKDSIINYGFRSDNVGKCMDLLSDFISTGQELTKTNWENYYFSKQSKEPLIQLSHTISRRQGIPLNLSKRYVFYRVIGQTWNGTMSEKMVIMELGENLPHIEFRKTDFVKDEKLFTDWEGYDKESGGLLFGIQVKPTTYYTMESDHQNESHHNHNVQRNEYKRIYGVPHYMVYYDNGRIYNRDSVIETIKFELENRELLVL